jgi:putative heme-binding domain-containing protein
LAIERSSVNSIARSNVSAAKCRARHARLFVLALLLFVALAIPKPNLDAQNPAEPYPLADIEYGSQIYVAQCSTCHGENGDGVPGINLRAGQFKRVFSDQDLRNTITAGVSGTGMPAFNLDAAELAGIVAYIRNMSSFDARSVTPGDEGRGKTLFEGSANCSGCHRVNGKGPRVAPDLSNIGAIRTADLLRRTLVDPTGAMLPANRSVRALTKDGKVITGRQLNEDTYTVQLIDEGEHLVSLLKADLREYVIIKTSSMPSYKDKLNSQELADVMAYLFSLKGSK